VLSAKAGRAGSAVAALPPIAPLRYRGAMFLAPVIADASTTVVTQTGVGLGSIIAVVCSWQRNRSILWAILAGIFSWFYVIYFALTRLPEETKP
jgi:hypothetical protein